MGYKNLDLDPRSLKFQQRFRHVISAVDELGQTDEVEVTFAHFADLRSWRHKAYEYQKITGIRFRIEVVDPQTLLLRPTRRATTGEPVMVHGKFIEELRDEHATPMRPLTPDEQEYIDEVVAKAVPADPTFEDIQKILTTKAGGSHDDDPGRSESGGDGTDSGTSPGHNSDSG